MIPRLAFHQHLTQALLFLNSFLMIAVFRARTFGTTALDFQILLKFGLALFTIAYALYYFRYWGHRLLKIDGVFYIPLILWFFVTCLYAPSPVYSIAAVVSILAPTLLLYHAASLLDFKQILVPLIWACTLITFISLIVFYVNPSFGASKEWVDGMRAPSGRISGITGQANTMGYVTAFACVIILCYRLYFASDMPKIYYLAFALNLTVQIMSNSRTSLIAMILAFGLAFLYKATYTRLAFLFAGICGAILFVAFVDIESFLTLFSRSGNIEEITTGTGRTEIWAQVLEKWSERPVFGWGYGSSGFIMPKFAHATPHAHNFFLQVLFTTGWVGIALLIPLLIVKSYYILKFQDTFKLTLFVFFIIHGLTEVSAFQGVANCTALTLSLILALPYCKGENRSSQAKRQ